jgi:alkanesulfonate monooxygenase SsuD/methylene tetrahydromethanopterin reductase-like flavin-dependent oxidoreductase (luciferase family)
MKFDIFHSIGRIDSIRPLLSDADVFRAFFAQTAAAEALGFGTIWVAESHFSSEIQKRHKEPVIPNYLGEVGLNADSSQLANVIFERTSRIGFGTAIMNIVGGNGGPIAAADRVRTLAWLNHLRAQPRSLHIGVASGRFPYINKPFGIVPRNAVEAALWPQYQQLIFAEALEIFLRLSHDEVLGSDDVTRRRIDRTLFKDDDSWRNACKAAAAAGTQVDPAEGLPYEPRWRFEPLKLVPAMAPLDWQRHLRFVLGSSCPVARDTGLRFGDLDVFNLSFTPPDKIEALHAEMRAKYAATGRAWARSRLPRTVLVFIDPDADKARQRASVSFDTYIEAMRGTAQVPPKAMLMERALIGDSATIRAQLGPDDPHGFRADDRLMLWFEFNQTDNAAVTRQMRQFAAEVMPAFGGEARHDH